MKQSSLGADSAAEEEREKIKKSETIHPQVSEIEMWVYWYTYWQTVPDNISPHKALSK